MEEIWEEDVEEPLNDARPLVSWEIRIILMVILTWQFCFGVSDAGVMALLSVLSKIFKMLSRNFDEGSILQQLAVALPTTLNGTMSLIGLDKDNFTLYIVCPRCSSVFSYDSGFSVTNGQRASNCCLHVPWPNHIFPSKRLRCGEILMKTVRGRCGTGNITLTPFKTYPYQSLKNAIQRLVSRKGFLELCEHWRLRTNKIPEEILCDVYEGDVWKTFTSVDGVGFLQFKHNLCFILNVDWFQPFTHTSKLTIYCSTKYIILSLYYRLFCWCYLSCYTKPATLFTI